MYFHPLKIPERLGSGKLHGGRPTYNAVAASRKQGAGSPETQSGNC
jgi:hypothetical protein